MNEDTMSASERLAARTEAFVRVAGIDADLRATFDLDPSLRSAGAARKLLAERSKWTARILLLGGQPGPAPVDTPRAEAV